MLCLYEGSCTNPNCNKSHATPTKKQLALYTESKAKRDAKSKGKPDAATPASPGPATKSEKNKAKKQKKKEKADAEPTAVAAPYGDSSAFVDFSEDDVSDHDTGSGLR